MKRTKPMIWIIGSFLLSLSPVLVSLAQSDCPTLVQQTIAEMGANCSSLDRNTACYGAHRVSASFSQVEPEGYFSQPSNRSGLAELQTIQTSPMNLDTQEWGAALMNVQANVPDTLPGQAVTFLLIGDVTVQNGVTSSTGQDLGLQVPVMTINTANVRSGPADNTNLVDHVPARTQLTADSISLDGRWLRVTYNGASVWISRQQVSALGDLSVLPVGGAADQNSMGPMQAFYFHTGIGQPVCHEAPPSLLVVQGPQQLSVDLSVNGAQLRVGSTVGLTTDSQYMHLWVFAGHSFVNNSLLIPTGVTIQAPLNPTGQAAGNWGGFRSMTQAELDAFSFVQQLPLPHYQVVLPTFGQIQSELAALSGPPPTLPPTAAPTVPAPIVTQEPPYVNFYADSTDLKPGECTTLHWETANISAVYIDGAPTVGVASEQVCPRATTTYTLLVVLRDGSRVPYPLVVNVEVIIG